MVGFTISEAQGRRIKFPQTVDQAGGVAGLMERFVFYKPLEGRRITIPDPADGQCGRIMRLLRAPQNKLRLTSLQNVTHDVLPAVIGCLNSFGILSHYIKKESGDIPKARNARLFEKQSK